MKKRTGNVIQIFFPLRRSFVRTGSSVWYQYHSPRSPTASSPPSTRCFCCSQESWRQWRRSRCLLRICLRRMATLTLTPLLHWVHIRLYTQRVRWRAYTHAHTYTHIHTYTHAHTADPTGGAVLGEFSTTTITLSFGPDSPKTTLLPPKKYKGLPALPFLQPPASRHTKH